MVGCFFLCSAGYGQDAEQVQGLKLPSLLGPSAGLERSELRQRWEGHRRQEILQQFEQHVYGCLLYTSPSPRDKRQSRMPSSA